MGEYGRRCGKCHGYVTAPAKDGAWCRCAVRAKPGTRWRVKADMENGRFTSHSQGHGKEFDELVVDDWLHVERMDTRDWWINLCGIRIWVTLPRDPKSPPRVMLSPDWPVGSMDQPEVLCEVPARVKGKRRTR